MLIKSFDKQLKGKGTTILIPKQMLQRFPIALAQVKAGDASENILNQIRQVIYSLCQEKEDTKKLKTFNVWNNESTKSKKITKDKNSKHIPHIEITEVVLIHCSIVSNDYQQDSGILNPFVPNKSLVQLKDISFKNFIYF